MHARCLQRCARIQIRVPIRLSRSRSFAEVFVQASLVVTVSSADLADGLGISWLLKGNFARQLWNNMGLAAGKTNQRRR